MLRLVPWLTFAAGVSLVGLACTGDWTVVDQLYVLFCGLTLAGLSVAGIIFGRRQDALNKVATLSSEIAAIDSEAVPSNTLLARTREIQVLAARNCFDKATESLLNRRFGDARDNAVEGLMHLKHYRMVARPLMQKDGRS